MKSLNPFDVTVLIAGLFLLVHAIRYQLRKRERARNQNRALFQNRLTIHTQSGPPNVSLLALAQRQLADWEHLLAELEASQAPLEQIRYCRQQVERFTKEVAWLREQ